MGIREVLNQKPALTTGVTAVVIVVGIGSLLYYSMSGSNASVVAGGPQAYFSDDDGKTVFRDDADKLPPFQHHGREAVGAFAISKDDGTNVVLYLLRYTAAGKELKIHPKASSLDDPAFRPPTLLAETEVKRPGDAAWVKMSDPRASAIMHGGH